MLDLDLEIVKLLEEMPSTEFEQLLLSALDENDIDRAEMLLIHKMATDMELYSVMFFPHYCELEFNPFHLELFQRFKFGERKIRRASGAPRGAAKSTHATLIRPLHDACYGTENFILFVSGTEPLANKKLKDVRAEVLSNSDLQDWFGIRFESKKVAESEFTVISDAGPCHFMAAGKGSQVRGIRWRNFRPSKIIFDDFESSEEVDNEKLRNKTEAIYHEEFGKTGNQATNIEFVGTVLHKDSLLSRLLKNPAYDTSLHKSIIEWSKREDLWNAWREVYRDKDNPDRADDALAYYKQHEKEMIEGTKVLWPEKESYYDHMLDMEEIGKRAFFKEKQNEPLGSDEPVFENIWWYKEESEGLRILKTGKLVPWALLKNNAHGAMDPSTGAVKAKKGKLGDFCCIPVGFHDVANGRLFVHDDYTKRAAPTKQIKEIFELHNRYNFQKFAVETNLFRNLLLPNIIEERKRREKESGKLIQLPFYDVVQTENKHERIHRLEPKVNHGYILFNVNLSPEFKTMLEDYPHHDNDDGPDALEILWNTIKGVYRASGMSMSNMGV